MLQNITSFRTCASLCASVWPSRTTYDWDCRTKHCLHAYSLRAISTRLGGIVPKDSRQDSFNHPRNTPSLLSYKHTGSLAQELLGSIPTFTLLFSYLLRYLLRTASKTLDGTEREAVQQIIFAGCILSTRNTWSIQSVDTFYLIQKFTHFPNL